MFRPWNGMFYEKNEENIKKWKENTLEAAHIDFNDENYFSTCDRFHIKSKKKSAEISFRDISNCPQLNFINTSIAEQRNAVMSKHRLVYITQIA